MSGNLVPFRNGNAHLVLDTWPLMEWLKRKAPASRSFLGYLSEAEAGNRQLMMSSINYGEVFYSCWKLWGEAHADEVHSSFQALPIQIIHPSQSDVLVAARIKGAYSVSYADAFAAALAIEFSCPVLTGDPDFLMLAASGLVSVEWIGA